MRKKGSLGGRVVALFLPLIIIIIIITIAQPC
jgi:hypothetical protein